MTMPELSSSSHLQWRPQWSNGTRTWLVRDSWTLQHYEFTDTQRFIWQHWQAGRSIGQIDQLTKGEQAQTVVPIEPSFTLPSTFGPPPELLDEKAIMSSFVWATDSHRRDLMMLPLAMGLHFLCLMAVVRFLSNVGQPIHLVGRNWKTAAVVSIVSAAFTMGFSLTLDVLSAMFFTETAALLLARAATKILAHFTVAYFLYKNALVCEHGLKIATLAMVVTLYVVIVIDLYRIEVMGEAVPSEGLVAIRNTNGDKLTPRLAGTDRDVYNFRLSLGAQVIAVVPQPVERLANGTLAPKLDTIRVYFNNDDLNAASATNPNFYQLIDPDATR